jgi:hypothetical protein
MFPPQDFNIVYGMPVTLPHEGAMLPGCIFPEQLQRLLEEKPGLLSVTN